MPRPRPTALFLTRLGAGFGHLDRHALHQDPAENIRRCLRDSWLSNRMFASYQDTLEECCQAWNRLFEPPRIIMPIGTRDWAYRLGSIGFAVRRSITQIGAMRVGPLQIICTKFICVAHSMTISFGAKCAACFEC